MARPWPFVEREKPASSLGGQDESNLSYNGGTDGEGEPLYGTALMASGPAAFKHKFSAGDDSVTVLVDSEVSGHYFDDLIIPSLKHRLLNYVLCKILTAGGALPDEGEPLYGTALMASGPAAFKHKFSAGDDSVTVLVDSEVSGHYFDDLIIPSLKHRLLNYVLCKILTAGGALPDGTAKGILQGLVTDNQGEHHLAWIAILIVPDIGCNLFSIKSTTKNGVVSIFDLDNLRLELSGITVPLRA